jgi:hypothetical protein
MDEQPGKDGLSQNPSKRNDYFARINIKKESYLLQLSP